MHVTLIMILLWKTDGLPVANHSATNEAAFKSRSLKQADEAIPWSFELDDLCLGMYTVDEEERESIAEPKENFQCMGVADSEHADANDEDCYRGTCNEGLCLCCHPLTETIANIHNLKKPYGVWSGANCGQFIPMKEVKGKLEKTYERWQDQKTVETLKKQDQMKEELMAKDLDNRPKSFRKFKASEPCVMGDTCFRGYCRDEGKDLVCKDCFTYDDPEPGKYHGEFCSVFIPDYLYSSGASSLACSIDKDCTGHGFCNTVVQPAMCICDPGWSGYYCEKRPPAKCYSTAEGICNKKGKCKKKTDPEHPEIGKYRYCQCKKGYGGLACERSFQCRKDDFDMCHPKHGICQGSSKKQCKCTSDAKKYIGQYCRPKKTLPGGEAGEKTEKKGDSKVKRLLQTLAKIPAAFRHRGNGKAFAEQLGDNVTSDQLSPLEAFLQKRIPGVQIENIHYNYESAPPAARRKRLVPGKDQTQHDSDGDSVDRDKNLVKRKVKSLKRNRKLVKRQDDAEQDIITQFDVTFEAGQVEDVQDIQEQVTESLNEQTELLDELYGSEFSYVEGSVTTGKVELLSVGDDVDSSKEPVFFGVVGAGLLVIVGGVCVVIKLMQAQTSMGKKDKKMKEQRSYKKNGKSKSALGVEPDRDGKRKKMTKSSVGGKKSKSRATSKTASAKISNRSTIA